MREQDRAHAKPIPQYRAVIFCLALFTCLAILIASCTEREGGGQAEVALRLALDKARSLVSEGSTLSFRQKLSLRLFTPAGDLEQTLEMEGDIHLPASERYALRESWKGSALEDEEGGKIEEMSYVTLDGGKSAYVRSSRLERELGYGGWIYLTNAQGKERFLDYLVLLESSIGDIVEVSEGGKESVGGRLCRHLYLRSDVQAMLQRQAEEDPALRERLEKAEGQPEILDAHSEIWLEEESHLPIRVYNMMLMEVPKSGERFEMEMWVDFLSYGAELRPPLDAPAVYTVVELP